MRLTRPSLVSTHHPYTLKPMTLIIWLLCLSNLGCVTHYRAKAIEVKILALENKLDQVKSEMKSNQTTQNATLENIIARFKQFEQDINKAISSLRQGSAQDIGDIDSLRELITRQQDALSRVQFELESVKKARDVALKEQSFPKDKEALYRKAEQLLIDKSYADAVRFYSEFVKRYPGDVRADDSLYHIAEAYYQQRRFSEGVSVIEQIINEYPNENQADKALILLHDTYMAMNKCSKAKKALLFLETTYPRSNQLRNAKRKLSRLKCK